MKTKLHNYKCKKCGSTYTNLPKELTYSTCVAESPQNNNKCNGELIKI